MAKGDRILNVARARVIIPAAGGVWTAAAIMHAAHVGPLYVLFGSVAAAAVAGRARPAWMAVAGMGAWVTAATAYGPAEALTVTWGIGTVAAIAAAHCHPSVRKAKDWRRARMEHLATAHRRGLGGSHLVHHERTRLGVVDEYDVIDTGKLASQLAGGSLAELIAQEEGLALSRVQVSCPRPGRLRVSIRHTDPWKNPVAHPLFDSDPEIELPVPATIRAPLPIGQDPETGDPLTLTLWDDEGGAKTILVVAKRRAGKTTMLSALRERITAAEDADLWNINLSKAQEDREWAPLCERSACGPGERKKAFSILREARNLIDARGAAQRDNPLFQPTATDRLKVLIIDEVDALVAAGGPWVKEELAYIASKAGSEGVVLITAGQRATAAWSGGGNVRANMETVVIGRVRDAGEVQHALGQRGVYIPDLTTYGEGHKGVWVIVDDADDHQAGRAFNLRELTDIREIVTQRSRVSEMVAAGNLPVSNLLAGNHSPGHGPPDGFGQPMPSGDAPASEPRHTGDSEPHDDGGEGGLPFDDVIREMETQVMSDLPDDLRDQLGKISKRNVETRKIIEETNRMPPPVSVDPEAQARSTAERWRQAAEQTVIPDNSRAKLLALLAGEGMSGRKITEAFSGVKRYMIMYWLNRLRHEGLAQIEGKGRAARWVRTQDGDAQ
jgi:hypothetical protein